jgi:putative ABC transport system permease protein
LQNLSGANALLKQDVIANDTRLFTRVFSAPLRLMVAIAFLVGTLVVGLIIYTATVERQREYGVLKAVGAHDTLLYGVVATQALLVTAVGAVAGLGFAFGAARLIMSLRPQFLITLEVATVIQTLLSSVVMALLAALFPAYIIAGVAPADVFRR